MCRIGADGGGQVREEAGDLTKRQVGDEDFPNQTTPVKLNGLIAGEELRDAGLRVQAGEVAACVHIRSPVAVQKLAAQAKEIVVRIAVMMRLANGTAVGGGGERSAELRRCPPTSRRR